MTDLREVPRGGGASEPHRGAVPDRERPPAIAGAARRTWRLQVQGWEQPESEPGMAAAGTDPRVSLTSRRILRDGRGWIPVSGEIHYSRVPRARWRERLLLMRSGGVDVASTYVIWMHHQPTRPEVRFDGNRDLAAFVRLCHELGLAVVVRIGPWVHGEVRNGGFPDWVQDAPVRHRTNDAAYLDLVRRWFGRIGNELSGLCGPDGPIIAVQIENELYDAPEHLLTLKRMAQEAGILAPLYSATAWGGAELPGNELFPLYSGYGDGFWVDAQSSWDDTFRQHYFFSDEWDDPGVGADVRGIGADAVVAKPRSDAFPPATCELGGGMATTYHRRIVPTGADIAAVANAKIGSGSMWQGFYMYAGGTNPPGGMQESHASGYPNDLPELDYDFHAAIGAAGQLANSHAALRRQHAFLAAFGAELTCMPSTLPDDLPTGLDDSTTPRWAVRADSDRGFLFLNWHQPHVPLPALEAVRLTVLTGERELVFGDRPARVEPGTIARWPFGMAVGDAHLEWATGSALTRLGASTLVLEADPGRDVEVRIGGPVSRTFVVDGTAGGHVRLEEYGVLGDVVVVGRRDVDKVWVLDGERRRLLLSDHPVWLEDDQLVARADTRPDIQEWDGTGWRRVELSPDGPAVKATAVGSTLVRPAREPLASYGSHVGRASAPDRTVRRDHGAVFLLDDVGEPRPGARRTLTIGWAGDVAELLVGDDVVADRFWDGSPWHIDLDALDAAEGATVTLRIVGLHRDAQIWLEPAAERRRRAHAGALLSLDTVTLSVSTTWRAVPPTDLS